jgi:alpha-beta hydrolase superfamily lysophospholipase
MGPNGWMGALNSMKMLSGIILKENPGLPLFLLGHSWGSFLAQHYMQEFGSSLRGAILSGTNGKQKLLAVGSMFANKEAKKLGMDGPGDQLHELSFAGYDKKIKNRKTKFDWLSRDEAQVQKYVNDPKCGFICKVGFFVELLFGLRTIWSSEQEAKIPKGLPVYIYNGEMDPVGSYTKAVAELVERYRAHGITDLKYKVYGDGARHEMHNELNKAEVYKDVIGWLDAHV